MVKILVYAQLCIHNMTCAVSLQLKVPVKFNHKVSKLSKFFFFSISIKIDLWQIYHTGLLNAKNL